MKAHSNETLQRSSLSRQMTSHKNHYLSESFGYEARNSKETPLSYENNPIPDVDYRAKDDGVPACSTMLSRTKPDLHSSEVPYIINVKQEEDI